VAFPTQTRQQEPPSISDKSLQSDENDLQPYITVFSPQLERKMNKSEHECSIFGKHSYQIQRSLDEANVFLTYLRICNQLKSFFFTRNAGGDCWNRTKEILNIILVRYILYIRHVKHAARGPHAALCKHTCGPHKGYFNGQNYSFYNLNWINMRRSQKNDTLFFIQNVCMHIVCF
jgi:hypothetical protein